MPPASAAVTASAAPIAKAPLVLPAAFKEKPPAVVCHLCGRDFGTTSLAIHIKSCVRKWERKQLELPAVRLLWTAPYDTATVFSLLCRRHRCCCYTIARARYA